MNNFKKFIIAGFVFLGLLSSCEKDNELQNDKANSANLKTAGNPLEYIGVEHNIFMTKFMTQLENSYSKGEFKSINFLSNDYKEQFCKVTNSAFLNVNSNCNSTVALQKKIYDDLDLNEWYDNDTTDELMIAEAVLIKSASVKDRTFTMNLLRDVYSACNLADNEAIYKELDKVITKHENLILSENWNSSENNALGTLAVAKYSTQFWKNYDFSKFDNTKSANTAARKRNPRSGVIVAADAVGYVAGGVIGGVAGTTVGSVTLGAGTVAGVIGGKFVGAWAGSGDAAGAIAIYDAFTDWF